MDLCSVHLLLIFDDHHQAYTQWILVGFNFPFLPFILSSVKDKTDIIKWSSKRTKCTHILLLAHMNRNIVFERFSFQKYQVSKAEDIIYEEGKNT